MVDCSIHCPVRLSPQLHGNRQRACTTAKLDITKLQTQTISIV
jgi:hypothetical protein